MPVYEYQCNKCGRGFEYQMRMSDPDKTVCEACGAPALEKVISRTAFQLKGGGWYKDLYASTKPEAPAGATPAAEAKPAAPSDATAAAPAAPAAPAAAPAAPAAAPSSGSGTGGSSGSGAGGGSSSGGSSSTSSS